MVAVHAMVRNDRFMRNEVEVADTAILRRDYILRYANGDDSTVIGGQFVFVPQITYFHGDTAVVDILKRGPGRAARTGRPIVDNGGTQQWRFVYVDTAWVGKLTYVITN